MGGAAATSFVFWIDQGVRIFRVDNPHTKPFAVLGVDDRARRGGDIPESIFLAEAFTRPKVMYRLAKLGFTQSYTYFTWRNTKRELTEYFTELTQTDVLRVLPAQPLAEHAGHPHRVLQLGGRAGVHGAARAGGHAGASYGIYGPAFELARETPARARQRGVPRFREVRVRHWDRDAPGQPAASSSRG